MSKSLTILQYLMQQLLLLKHVMMVPLIDIHIYRFISLIELNFLTLLPIKDKIIRVWALLAKNNKDARYYCNDFTMQC